MARCPTRLLVLAALVLAEDCGLPDEIDPDDTCFVSEGGWANMNVDAVVDGRVSLHISTIAEAYTDADGFVHGPHPGSLDTSELESNGRYVLSCPDEEQMTVSSIGANCDSAREDCSVRVARTLRFSVTRPSEWTQFNSEWVLVFEKDKWDAVNFQQNETEYKVRNYGYKEPYLWNVADKKVPRMKHREFGRAFADDAEANYLNYDSSEDPTEVIHVFVGVPEAGDYEVKYGTPHLKNGCPDVGDPPVPDCGPVEDDVGRWITLEFKSTLLRIGSPWAACGEAENYEAAGTIIPAYFGHPNLHRHKYDDVTSAVNAHSMTIYAVLQIFTPTSGSVTIDDDGTVHYKENAKKWTKGDADSVDDEGTPYTKCYKAGEPCPGGFNVCDASYCSIQQWKQIVAALKDGNPKVKVLAYVETVDEFEEMRAKELLEADAQIAMDEVGVDGFYFSHADGAAVSADILAVSAAWRAQGATTVLATGSALFDAAALASVDVLVTAVADRGTMGGWNPFGWYSAEPPGRWGAMVADVSADKVAITTSQLYDRGYGYVYLHSEDLTDAFGTVSSTLTDFLAAVAAQTAGSRRLAEASDGLVTETWACDDTQFECGPICLRTHGLTTVRVPEAQCASVPLDPCACNCLYEVQWACKNGVAVCTAKSTNTMKHQDVADSVCTSRGTPKPATCVAEPVWVARGSRPTSTCEWQFQQRVDKLAELATAEPAVPTSPPAPPAPPGPPPPPAWAEVCRREKTFF
jgi:hypothetical protein